MPRELFYDNLRQIIDDVQRLRRGYTQEGNWTLAQICRHNLMVPATWLKSPASDVPETDLQKKMKPLFPAVLAKRQLPGKIDAPDHLVPPTDTPDSAIDDFIAFTQERIDNGFPAINHRLWGNITPQQAEQMMLIHSANHLRYLHPTE